MTFLSEADLCKQFSEYAVREGWMVCNEHEGWDMMLHRESTGEQLGIQAKLLGNVQVVWQAFRGMQRERTPDVGVVLVPKASPELRGVCLALGLAVAESNTSRSDLAAGYYHFEVTMPVGKEETRMRQRCSVPKHPNEAPAGVPSPRKFTKYTERELRLEVLFHRRGGWVNTKDFQRVGLRTTNLPPWLCRTRSNHFEQVIGSDLPSKHHPSAFVRAQAEMEAVRT